MFDQQTSNALARSREGSFAVALGPLVAALAAGLLSAARDDVGVTNVALVLAMIVVVAALAGRMAGIVTALTAALAFNFFHTEPYHSMRITGARDVVTVALLALLGLVVAEVAEFRRRARATSARRLHGAEVLEATSAMLARQATFDEMWPTVAEALREDLQLSEIDYEPGATTTHPVLSRSGSLVAPSMHVGRGGFALPPGGAAIAVAAADQTFGHIVMTSRPETGSSIDARRVAVAVADQLAVAILASRSRQGGAADSSFSATSR